MISEAATRFFVRAKTQPFPFSCEINGDVPIARGLGSSVTVRLGLLHGLNYLSGTPLNRGAIFQIAAELEGHPDNAAPGQYGGFVVSGGRAPQRFPLDARLSFVFLIPAFEIKTALARRALPDQISHGAAVDSARHASVITAAFVSRRYENLRGAFQDHLHKPYRAKFVPFLLPVISAGEKAGALGGFLSGSGSSVCCLTLRNPEKIAFAMFEAANSPGATTVITSGNNRGARITGTDPRTSGTKDSHAKVA